MAPLHVLTFNFHEPYLCLLAKTGYRFTVGLYERAPLARAWQVKFRPVPKNASLVEEAIWRRDLAAGKYDVVVAHNETNAADLFRYETPCLLVCHNRKSFLKTTLPNQDGDSLAKYEQLLERLQERFTFVFISESKRTDYGIPGEVIPPGIDLKEFHGYHGTIPEVLRVGNAMRARNRMFDVDFQEQVCAGIPNRVAGDDPAMPTASPSRSYEDLLDHYRSLRCLLHVTREDWEDGYNLAMLEAMACGMPVVALANRTSPLTDGVDGYTAYQPEILRERLRALLADRELAHRIGENGRETVARRFPIAPFVENWGRVLEEAASRSPGRKGGSGYHPHANLPRQRIVLDYVATPLTTARYFECALRKRHRVITAGFRCPEALFPEWGFPEPIPTYPAQQIDVPLNTTYEELMRRMPDSFAPDLYLWVDSGAKTISPDITRLKAPKISYLIDTHLAPELRLEIAHNFDFTFMAQKGQVAAFARAGIRNVAWLPLACSPELHAGKATNRIYDVAYVGRLSEDLSDRRRDLLRGVARRFPNHKIGQFWPEEMAGIYARSKIVVNAAVNRDLNMRVFEAMASGALLITDEADGLAELFEPGKHFVLYREDGELFELIEEYLKNDEARKGIADAGSTLVRSEHTYDRRAEQMLTMVLEALGVLSGGGESRFHFGGYYRSPRPELMQHIPTTARRVLDCGCGAGEFGRALKQRGVVEVVGIEVVERAWKMAKRVLDDALLGNIEHLELPFGDGYFDCICFGDVLEHLVDPAAVLRKVSRVLAPDGLIVMSIPNVRFCQVIAMLANGRWKYEDAGILDRTHLRFFTAPEMRELVQEAGLELVKLQPLSMLAPRQLPRQTDGTVALGRATLRPADDADYLDLLVYQYLVVAGKLQADPLARAQHALEANDNDEAYRLADSAIGANEAERKKIMAKAIARVGKLDRAEGLYREVLELSPFDTDSAREFGLVLVAAKRPDEARSFFDRALAANPDDDRAIAGLGLVSLLEGDSPTAFKQFRRALTINFDNEPLLDQFLLTATRLERLAEAEPILRRFVDFYPGRLEMACRYAELLHRLGRDSEAVERLDTLLLLVPEHERAAKLLNIIRKRPDETGA